MVTLQMQILWCEPGQHRWDRAAKRGRPPVACPEHANQQSGTGYPLPTKEKKPSATKRTVKRAPKRAQPTVAPSSAEPVKSARKKRTRKAKSTGIASPLTNAPSADKPAKPVKDGPRRAPTVTRTDTNSGSSTTTATNKEPKAPKVLTEAQKRKMQAGRLKKKAQEETAQNRMLRGTISNLEAQLVRVEREDEKTHKALQRSKSDKNFNAWMRANTTLMNTLAALTAHRQKLAPRGP